MRHQKHRRSLGVSAPHRRSMMANMVVSLIDHNRIKTTRARAKEASKIADKMITLAKKNTLHARRQIIAVIRSKAAAKRLIDDLAPLFKEREGGYTRVLRLQNRVGDNAEMALLEFTAYPEVKEIAVKDKKSKPKKEDGAPAEGFVPEKRSQKSSFFSGLRNVFKK